MMYEGHSIYKHKLHLNHITSGEVRMYLKLSSYFCFYFFKKEELDLLYWKRQGFSYFWKVKRQITAKSKYNV